MKCLVCLEPPSESIEIFGEIGEELGIAKILEKHFWFTPVKDDGISSVICQICWLRVNDFHEFYVQVEQAHLLLSNESSIAVEPPDVKVFPEPENIIMLPEPKVEMKLPPEGCDEPLIMLPQPKLGTMLPPGASTDEPLLIPQDIAKPEEKDLFADVAEVLPKVPARRPKRSCNKKEELSPSLSVSISKATTSRKRNPKKEPADTDDTHEATDDETEPNGVHRNPTTKVKYEKRRSFRNVDQLIGDFMKLICAVCEQEKATFIQLKRHMEEEHEERKGYAVCCNKKFLQRCQLADHVRCHLDPTAFQCKECQKTFTNLLNLRAHINIHHLPDEQRDFPCPECPARFAKAHLMEKHRLALHAERTHTCYICERRLPSLGLLQGHIKAMHTKEYDIICEVCAKPVRGQEAYERHKLEHAGITAPRVQCTTCGIWLASLSSMKRHVKVQHAEARKAAKCHLCGKVYKRETNLRLHHRNVHADRPHACLLCDKRFRAPKLLRMHMASHTGQPGYTCPWCPRTFKYTGTMLAHRKMWHPAEYKEEVRKRRAKFAARNPATAQDTQPVDEAPVEFKCPECDKVYPNEFAMKKHHRNMHTGKRPHACSQCDMRFRAPYKLKEHMAVHTREKLYTCDFCPLTFRSSSTMYGHRKHKHPEEYQKLMQQRIAAESSAKPSRRRKKKALMTTESSNASTEDSNVPTEDFNLSTPIRSAKEIKSLADQS